jgi:hypothetical protein
MVKSLQDALDSEKFLFPAIVQKDNFIFRLQTLDTELRLLQLSFYKEASFL